MMTRLGAQLFTKLAVAATALTASVSAYAADDWPNRPVSIVVAFAPGGSTDILARKIVFLHAGVAVAVLRVL